ncbi:MAG: Flp pilus assembly protein TadB [Friedmanniella sp.]|nr:Flp pilus assembly protein TadB [Friedmanniella sp.]
MTGAAAVAAGLLICGGLLLLVMGLQRREAGPARRATHRAGAWSRLTRRPDGARGRRRDALLAASLVVGLAVAGTTGWVLALPLAPALALGLPYLLAVPKPREVELLEAMDRWVRSLAATLGTGRSVTDAIRISRRTAPPMLAEEVAVLVARLNNRWPTRDALLRFADALDSPDTDGVVAALILASQRGADGASVTLHALADSIQAQLKGRRVIQVEQSKPYVVVRQVTVISLGTLAVVFALSPQFFAPYRTPVGQLVLGVLGFLYAGSLLLMRQKARQRPRARILVGVPR